MDTRDGFTKTGSQLSCGRTNRSVSRHTVGLNERIYRGHKTSKGRVSIRKKHYSLRPGDQVAVNNKKYFVAGMQNNGTRVLLADKKSYALKKVVVLKHCNAWATVV